MEESKRSNGPPSVSDTRQGGTIFFIASEGRPGL